jgi:GTP-binding protein HflX
MDGQSKVLVVTYPDEFARQEAVGLAEAAGYQVVHQITQKFLHHAEYGVGSGKAEELKEMTKQVGSKVIIVDERLTSSQANNLSKLTGQQVIDRERLILDIFSKRAQTTEAKLQVELAELKYEMPRAKENVRLSVKGEQQGLSGMGEYAVDVRFRDLKRRMSFVKEKLREASRRRSLHRTQRQKLNMPFVSLVGYTSSGKTTLFNRLADEEKEVASSLFTTLTTTTRSVVLPDSTKMLLSDTVGFISRLPTYMIEAFKSTLDELTYADLVLLLLDTSEPLPDIRIKYESCMQILQELKVSPSKVIVLLNKSDQASKENIADTKVLLQDESSIVISAKRGDGTRLLKNLIQQYLYNISINKATLASSVSSSN